MFTCPKCNQKFLRQNQTHSCNDKTLDDFLRGKSAITVNLYHFFVNEYMQLGNFTLRATKSAIAFSGKVRFGYIHRLGKNFVDVVLQFPEAYEDNFCFHKIAGLPEGNVFNHYLRIYDEDDLNEEVKKYMKKALAIGNRENTKHF